MSVIGLYMVGGYVRDQLLDLPSKDVDFAVEAESFAEMRKWLIDTGFQIFVETPEYLTIRAHVPKRGFTFAGEKHTRLTADFVLCRKDGAYSDGRRPDEVIPGTLFDDLARRDFTVNAIAIDHDGLYIDPHGGMQDLENGILQCVGSSADRFSEDALRALRAIRFSITKNLMPSKDIQQSLRSDWLSPLVAKVSAERRLDEIMKMMKHDTILTLDHFFALPAEFLNAMLSDNIRLFPTLKQ